MATHCSTPFLLQFQPRVALDFEGGALSTDAGLIVLRELDERLGLTRGLEGLLEDRRDPRYVQHPLAEVLRQRLYQIAAGYEDAIDANLLRQDPTFQLLVHPARPTEPLASQPTLSRQENRATWRDVARLAELSLEWFLRHGAWLRQQQSQEILLDADSTEDPTHGQQQLALFHGKYGTYMYQPLLIFEGHTGHLLASRLRPGTVADAEGILPELKRLVPRLRRSFPKAPIRFRADAGFSPPALYDYLDREQIDYLIGIPAHTCFERWIAPVLRRAKRRFEQTATPVRMFSSFFYRARRWPRRRRILVKVEVNSLGTNVRCVITNRRGRAEELFGLYQGRGETENRIDELKNDLKADRLSCSRYRANAFRLQLHCLAYNLMNFLRHSLRGTELARAEASTLRLKLFKVAARIQASTRRIWFHLSSSWPLRSLFCGALEAVRQCRLAPG
jgi:Transposase DDE domain group 1